MPRDSYAIGENWSKSYTGRHLVRGNLRRSPSIARCQKLGRGELRALIRQSPLRDIRTVGLMWRGLETAYGSASEALPKETASYG
jgi:hypothetical protein